MVLTHKVFLFWLLYAVVVLFGWCSLIYLGLPQIALHYDHSYLTYLLLGLYAVAEILSGRCAWWVSKENTIADGAIRWLSRNKLVDAVPSIDGAVVLVTEENKDRFEVISSSVIADHFSLLCVNANAGRRRLRQGTMLDVTADRLYEKTTVAEFISNRIVWIGILATILGVIMAFWPMINGGTIEAMQSNIGSFFGGIAVAFIPTAVSFVFKIILDFNAKIIGGGVRDLIDKVAVVSETFLLPVIDNEGDDAPLS